MVLTRTHALIAGFSIAMGLLGLVAWVGEHQIDRIRSAAEATARTHDAQLRLHRLLSLVQDVETGARGFVITGDPTFLEPFEAARGQAESTLQSLCTAAGATAARQVRCGDLAPLVSERVRLSQASVERRRTEGFEAARTAIVLGVGKSVMDRIRDVAADMDAAEQALAGQRAVETAREATAANRTTAAATGLAVALLTGMFALVLGENRASLRAQAQLDRFFTLSLDMLCIAGADGYFKRVSPAFTQALGYSVDELLARPFLDFVHPDDRAATMAEVDKLAQGVPTINFDNRYRCRDGSWRWLSWKTQPIAEEGLLYATARDITLRKQAEAQVAELNEDLRRRAVQLEVANQELESFSYSVSHDLRAPLRHVHGYVEMLQRVTDGQLSEQARRYLATIADASVEMGALIDDLLTFSRMGRTEMRESEVDLNGLVTDAIGSLDLAIADRHIVWEIASLPPVAGDPALLKLVVANLVGNAVKYSRMRHPARIEIGSAGREGDRMVFFVRDNGAGFDMQYAGKLFGVFQRLHRADEFEGTGIGLATVRRVVARHGGRVWAEAAVDQGATIYFTLTLHPSSRGVTKGADH